jgi:hypothetical protein
MVAKKKLNNIKRTEAEGYDLTNHVRWLARFPGMNYSSAFALIFSTNFHGLQKEMQDSVTEELRRHGLTLLARDLRETITLSRADDGAWEIASSKGKNKKRR